jgi:hypothetical protein
MDKTLFKGEFNWYGEVHTLYRWAYSERQAKYLFITAICDIICRHGPATWKYFYRGKDNHKITKEVRDV